MAYGIEIQNADGRIVIDTTYANFGFFSNNLSTATAGSTYPGLANAVFSDLIAARTNASSNGFISRSLSNNGNNWATSIEALSNTAIRYYVIRRFTELSPNTVTGYGFAVYNSSSNVIFSANITKNFEIITTGVFNSNASGTVNTSFPSSNTWYSNFDKYYSIVNSTGTIYFQVIIGAFPDVQIQDTWYRNGYNHVWANSTHGRIVVENNYQQRVGTGPISTFTLDRDFHYMILKELS